MGNLLRTADIVTAPQGWHLVKPVGLWVAPIHDRNRRAYNWPRKVEIKAARTLALVRAVLEGNMLIHPWVCLVSSM